MARYVQRLRPAQGLSRRQRVAPKRVRSVRVSEPQASLLTPRAATWRVLKRPDKRAENDETVLQDLSQRRPELAQAIALARDFADLGRERQPDELDPWLKRAAACQVDAFRRFAKRLQEDYDSIKAGVTLPWSNGPVEGHVNRLKMVKRQIAWATACPLSPKVRQSRLYLTTTGTALVFAFRAGRILWMAPWETTVSPWRVRAERNT